MCSLGVSAYVHTSSQTAVIKQSQADLENWEDKTSHCTDKQRMISQAKLCQTVHNTKQIDCTQGVCVHDCLPLHACWVHKHRNRHDLQVSAVSCVSQALSVHVKSLWFPCHYLGLQSTALHSISVSLCLCSSTCMSVFTRMCVSICLLSPAVLSTPLGPVKIKGHFSKG